MARKQFGLQEKENPDFDLVVERMHEAKALFTAATTTEAKQEAQQAVAALEALLLWHDYEVIGVEPNPAEQLMQNLRGADGEEEEAVGEGAPRGFGEVG